MLFIVVMAVLQGIAEFLPISSSLHLLVASRVLDFQQAADALSAISVFLNLGTIAALFCYYREEMRKILRGGCQLYTKCIKHKNLKIIFSDLSEEQALFLNIIIANIPTIIVFGTVELCFGGPHFSSNITLCAIVFFSVVIFFCDRQPSRKIGQYPTLSDWCVAGLFQVMSIIPGASRLGTTLSAFRLLSFNRTDSFKYSMLLSIPPVICANLAKGAKILMHNEIEYSALLMLFGIVVALVFGILTLFFVNSYIKRHTFNLFVVYRLIFAVSCLYWGIL